MRQFIQLNLLYHSRRQVKEKGPQMNSGLKIVALPRKFTTIYQASFEVIALRMHRCVSAQHKEIPDRRRINIYFPKCRLGQDHFLHYLLRETERQSQQKLN